MNVRFAGWKPALALGAAFMAAEIAAALLGGDLGGFLWVTAHFVVMPLLSLGMVIAIVAAAIRAREWQERVRLLSSAIIPAGILYLVVDVSTWVGLMKSLGLTVRG